MAHNPGSFIFLTNPGSFQIVNRRTKSRRKPVTIIVGIICENGIVVASDSQTTHGNSRLHCNKVSCLEFIGGKAIVAQSGASDLSSRAVQILTEKAKQSRIADDRSVARLAEESVREVHNYL